MSDEIDDESLDAMNAAGDQKGDEQPSLCDLPAISVPRGGIIAAGGWCAPPGDYFDMFAPMTDAETIVYLRKALANEKFKVKNLRRAAKLQRKHVAKLEHALAEQVLRG